MIFSTKELEEMVAPASLEDILENLFQTGAITHYRLDEYETYIRVAKHVEIASLIKEESTPKLGNPVSRKQKKK